MRSNLTASSDNLIGASIHEKNNQGTTALMTAAFSGASDTVSLLIEKGAALNEQNDAGETALLLAVRGLIARRKDDHIETVRRLMAAGADCRIRDNNGFAPLDLAIEEEHSEIVEIIKEGLEDRRNGEIVRRAKTLERQAYLKSHAPRWSLKRGPSL